MRFASRKFALVLLGTIAIAAVGCGSNNKGKIEGKWKITAMPQKVQGKNNEMEEMNKLGMYVYLEFKPDGSLTFGLGADKPDMLNLIKAAAPNQKITWDAKYKLRMGDGVEFYDLPKDFEANGGGLFGQKDKASVKIKIEGDNMKMTDADGTATLTKVKE